MVDNIGEHREVYGVEPICAVFLIASSTYYDSTTRPLSARAIRDAMLMPILLALFSANYKACGAHKLWKAARRTGHVIGRDQVARLMRQSEIRGVSRSRKGRTTVPDDKVDRPADLVERDFTADRPNRLWVTDLTFVSTWEGTACVFHRRRAEVRWRVQ